MSFSWLYLVVATLAASAADDTTPVQHAYLETCQLENQQTILDCHLTYRWYGTPKADLSNIVVLPSWYAGTVNSWETLLGPGKMVHISDVAFLAIDAFGDGEASSPTNSLQQPGSAFPEFSIVDIVRAQHRVLTELLGITHVHGIVGVSMGGMQALQWAVTYPDFADAIVSLASTPKTTEADGAPWREQITFIDEHHATGSSLDRRYQLVAMLGHDIGAGQPLSAAAKLIRAITFLVFDKYDRLLHPEPSRELAALIPGAISLELNTPCGHFSPAICSARQVGEAVHDFFTRLALSELYQDRR